MRMIDVVLNAYAPRDFWSKAAKRTCRRLLFFRPLLTWRRIVRGFLEEYLDFEDNVGYLPWLERTGEVFRDFLARLICRLRRMGELTEAEHESLLAALRGKSAVPDVRSERAQALILKACLELGRRDPMYKDALSGSEFLRGIRTVEEIVVMSIDSRLPNPGSGRDLERARSIPEYHLALDRGSNYHSAVEEVSRAHDYLDEAFNDIMAKTCRSEREEQFASNYTKMADWVEGYFQRYLN